MQISRVFIALAALALAGCRSSMPTSADMERFYHAAEQQAQRDIDRLAERRASGQISPDEYERREAAIRDSIPRRASQMAWARHELVESERRALGIPTADAPVMLDAPGRGTTGDSLYRPAGQVGPGYQGLGSGMWHGNQSSAMSGPLGVNP